MELGEFDPSNFDSSSEPLLQQPLARGQPVSLESDWLMSQAHVLDDKAAATLARAKDMQRTRTLLPVTGQLVSVAIGSFFKRRARGRSDLAQHYRNRAQECIEVVGEAEAVLRSNPKD